MVLYYHSKWLDSCVPVKIFRVLGFKVRARGCPLIIRYRFLFSSGVVFWMFSLGLAAVASCQTL